MYVCMFLTFHSDKEPHIFVDIKLLGFILNCAIRASFMIIGLLFVCLFVYLFITVFFSLVVINV